MEKYDVCIIGGGVLGCLTALELSSYPVSCLLVEKNEDFCLGISKANSAVLYPGYDHKPGTLKSRFTVEGNRRTAELCEKLGVPVVRCGSLMAAGGEAGVKVLSKKYRQGVESGVPGLLILDREETLGLEPCLFPEVTAALFSPNTAVIAPWRLGMEAGKQAEKSGTAVRFQTKIIGIRREGDGPGKESEEIPGGSRRGYILTLEGGEEILASCVVNAAGIFSHRIRELLFAPEVRIRPTMADYLVFGREDNPGLSHVVFYEPEDGGKGITLVPNSNGTILAGATERKLPPGEGAPFRTSSGKACRTSAADSLFAAQGFAAAAGNLFAEPKYAAAAGNLFAEPEHAVAGGNLFAEPEHAVAGGNLFAEPEHATEREGLRFLLKRAGEVCPGLSDAVPIRTFAGLRPNPYEVVLDENGVFSDAGRSIHSFVIKKETEDGSFVSLLGIKTPGITASVPIAEYVAGMILQACRTRTTAVPTSCSGTPSLLGSPEAVDKSLPLSGSPEAVGDSLPLSGSPEAVSDSLLLSGSPEAVGDSSSLPGSTWGSGSSSLRNPELLFDRIAMSSMRDLSFSEKKILAEKDPSQGKVVCRCEQVTEAEVLEAIRCGAGSAEGVKLRCGAGMGKCQGARCRESVELILEREKAGQNRDKNKETDRPIAVQAEEKENPDELMCDYLLIGAGVAGLSMAAELYRADPAAEILLVDREPVPGGVLVQCLHEGFPDSTTGRMLDGPGYLDLLWREVQIGVQAGKIRCLFSTHVTDLQERDQSGDMRSPAEPEQKAGQQKINLHYPVIAEAAAAGRWIRIRARYGILTCGAIERTAGMLMIPGTRPKGVYTAGEIQRMLNLENRLPGKKAVLVGTGNMGLIMADLMIRKGMEVVCILEREDHVTASAGNIRKYLTDPGALIPKDRILLRSEVGRIHGSPYLQGVTVRRADYSQEPFEQESAVPGTEENNTDYISCDTLVIAAGLLPDRQLLHKTYPQKNGRHDTRNDEKHDDREKDRYEKIVAKNDVSREKKRIFLFGNCEHIYSMVSAIRFEAGKMAEKIVKPV